MNSSSSSSSLPPSTTAINASTITPANTSTAAFAYPGLPNALPPTSNWWITNLGDITLYNPELFAIAIALFQHTFGFGLLFLLRGFSPKRALDLHYLTLIFAFSFVALPLVFLFDRRISTVKLLFFLEHEAIEYLLAIRVLAPPALVARFSGAIVLAAWCSLVAITIPVVLDNRFHHAADIVAWCAFVSDFLVGVSGLMLVRRWAISRSQTAYMLRKSRAEAMAGLAFMLHGFTTMPVGPIFTLVLYHNLDPKYFAWSFVAVFLSAFFAVALMMPVAALFFANIWWCCGSRRKVFPGQAEWYEELEQQVDRGSEKGRSAGQRQERYVPEESAPRYYAGQRIAHEAADDSRDEVRSPNEAWRVRLPEERTPAWRSFQPRAHRRTPSYRPY